MTEIYNLDKVDRAVVKAKFDGKEYHIKEPTVSDFVKISKLKLEELEGQLELVKILCPALFKKRWLKKPCIDTLTLTQRNLLVELAFQVVSGGKSDKGKLKLEELLQGK